MKKCRIQKNLQTYKQINKKKQKSISLEYLPFDHCESEFQFPDIFIMIGKLKKKYTQTKKK